MKTSKAVPQTAHTPGYTIENIGLEYGIRDSYGNLIASHIGTSETATALAAAPALLSALESIVWRATKGECCPALISMIIQDAQDAIAKAKGGAK